MNYWQFGGRTISVRWGGGVYGSGMGRAHCPACSHLPSDACQIPSLPEPSGSRCESTVNMAKKGHPAFPPLAKSKVPAMTMVCVREVRKKKNLKHDQERIMTHVWSGSVKCPVASHAGKRCQNAFTKINERQ